MIGSNERPTPRVRVTARLPRCSDFADLGEVSGDANFFCTGGLQLILRVFFIQDFLGERALANLKALKVLRTVH